MWRCMCRLLVCGLMCLWLRHGLLINGLLRLYGRLLWLCLLLWLLHGCLLCCLLAIRRLPLLRVIIATCCTRLACATRIKHLHFVGNDFSGITVYALAILPFACL